jgi:hypothetical protein
LGSCASSSGDVEVSELIEDQQERYRFEGQVQFGGGTLDGMSDAKIPPTLLARDLVEAERLLDAVLSPARGWWAPP